jgi:hypothetical protein
MDGLSPSAPPLAPDRRTGLIIFGIVQIILGLFAAGFVLIVAAGHELARQSGAKPSEAALASAVVVYGLGAAFFLTTGIGSIRCRRWARALTVVASALWMVAGVVGGLMIVVVMPRILSAQGQATTMATTGCVAGVVLAGGIILPLALFLFYRSENVRLTCERIDRKARWTDRVPLPVLAVILGLAFGALALIANLASPSFVILGRNVTGATAAITLFALAGLCAVLAVQLYRLKESAWWTLILLQLIGVAIAITTIMTSDVEKMVPAGTPAEVAAIYRDPLFLAVFAATWIAYFAFLVYLRRFFILRHEPRTRRADQSTFSE